MKNSWRKKHIKRRGKKDKDVEENEEVKKRRDKRERREIDSEGEGLKSERGRRKGERRKILRRKKLKNK